MGSGWVLVDRDPAVGAIELERFRLGVPRLEIDLAKANLAGARFRTLHQLKSDAEATLVRADPESLYLSNVVLWVADRSQSHAANEMSVSTRHKECS